MTTPIPSVMPPVSSPLLETSTLACHLTAMGRSAIAVVGIRGAHSWLTVQRHFQAATKRDWVVGQIRYGQWVSVRESSEFLSLAPESVVVTPMSIHTVEVHCHGGIAAVRRILADLNESGVATVDYAAYLAASSNEDLEDDSIAAPLCVREAQAMLHQALTPCMVAIALDQTRGALLRWAQTQLNALQSHADTPDTTEQTQRSAAKIALRADVGLELSSRRRVVLCGPPNVGKSSLINRIVGYHRNITHNQPGTTRDVVRAEATINGVACELIDTAGLRVSEDEIESAGVQKATNIIAEADVLVIVGDPDSPPSLDQLVVATPQTNATRPPDAATSIPTVPAIPKAPVITVLNKRDLLSADQASPRLGHPAETVLLTQASPLTQASLLTQAKADASTDEDWDKGAHINDAADGIDALVDAIGQHLRQPLPPRGAAVPVTARQHRLLHEIASTAEATAQADLLSQLIG